MSEIEKTDKKTARGDRIVITVREEIPLSEDQLPLLLQTLVRVAEAVLLRYIFSPRSLHILLSDDEELQALNASWRGIDRPTDVLSFAADEGETIRSVARVSSLGDIVISISRAQEQAEQYGHGLEREIGFLTAHGLLHLLGYDHMTPDDEKQMIEAQRVIMEDVDLIR